MDTIRILREKLEALETRAGTRRLPADRLSSFVHLFPKGLPLGSLVELLTAPPGCGASSLCLAIAVQACGDDKALVVLDRERRFYPPALARFGVNLDRTMIVQPKTPREALMVAIDALRCPAVGAITAPFEGLEAREYRRLQMAAESGGGIGLLARPLRALRLPSFARLRLRLSPEASADDVRRSRVEVVRSRDGNDGQVLLMEVRDEKVSLRLPPRMASATPHPRSARASG